ncbi:HPF/RaiA family ribosome-associated protein [Actinomadura xylanilytica]|uniref:HPF/RaiA family ribosome-associated protein n=2 Tax=Thermomonosporaceae TaxID=2012 RepID=UPI00255A8410|nr:HPF/RaiA family ribosome-associated protein [Actinomadura xylanilytica]MDL4770619.1 HPF/RaiA family ribosome-associated protein [Actinomadura xylanilytica]
MHAVTLRRRWRTTVTALLGENMNSTIRALPEIRFLTSGNVPEAVRDAARRAVRGALAEVSAEVTSIRVTLSVLADASLPRPALVQAIVDFDGGRVRAQAAAPDLPEAIGLLEDRLSVRAAFLRAG